MTAGPVNIFPAGHRYSQNHCQFWEICKHLYTVLQLFETSTTQEKIILEIQSERSFIEIIDFKKTQIEYLKSICHWYKWISLFLALINGNLVVCEGVKLSKALQRQRQKKKKKSCYRLCLWKHQLARMIKCDWFPKAWNQSLLCSEH